MGKGGWEGLEWGWGKEVVGYVWEVVDEERDGLNGV